MKVAESSEAPKPKRDEILKSDQTAVFPPPQEFGGFLSLVWRNQTDACKSASFKLISARVAIVGVGSEGGASRIPDGEGGGGGSSWRRPRFWKRAPANTVNQTAGPDWQ